MSNGSGRMVIVGIGDDGISGLTDPARRVLDEADALLGPPSTLRLLGETKGRQIPLDPDMAAAVAQVREVLRDAHPLELLAHLRVVDGEHASVAAVRGEPGELAVDPRLEAGVPALVGDLDVHALERSAAVATCW